jgi:PilZ domain
MKCQGGSAHTRNISASGVLFETAQPLALGDSIVFSITLNHLYPNVEVHLECLGKIVRVERIGERIQAAVETMDTVWSASWRSHLGPASQAGVEAK